MVEATGGLEQPLTAALCAAGLSVAVVNPRQPRDFAGLYAFLGATGADDWEWMIEAPGSS